MSGNSENLPNTIEDVHAVLQELILKGYVKRAWIAGSRSPKSSRTPREDSDWDILIWNRIPNFETVSPREAKRANMCVDYIYTPCECSPKAVEIYPKDRTPDKMFESIGKFKRESRQTRKSIKKKFKFCY